MARSCLLRYGLSETCGFNCGLRASSTTCLQTCSFRGITVPSRTDRLASSWLLPVTNNNTALPRLSFNLLVLIHFIILATIDFHRPIRLSCKGETEFVVICILVALYSKSNIFTVLHACQNTGDQMKLYKNHSINTTRNWVAVTHHHLLELLIPYEYYNINVNLLFLQIILVSWIWKMLKASVYFLNCPLWALKTVSVESNNILIFIFLKIATICSGQCSHSLWFIFVIYHKAPRPCINQPV